MAVWTASSTASLPPSAVLLLEHASNASVAIRANNRGGALPFMGASLASEVQKCGLGLARESNSTLDGVKTQQGVDQKRRKLAPKLTVARESHSRRQGKIPD